MATYCTCTVDIISKSGFSIRDGVAYCNNCSKPEVSSSPKVSSKPASEGNLLGDLFDFKFEKFVSVSYFQLLYGITVVLWTIVAVVMFVLLLANSSYLPGGFVFLFLIGIPAVYFLLLIYTRMSIELIVNFFQIGKDIKAIRESK
ncbi:Protein of unknown function DUF4282 [Candidatus Nanopelagicaceae bacterium]